MASIDMGMGSFRQRASEWLPSAAGLKTHAALIAAVLFSLTALLGGRAYSVAQKHFEDTRDLVGSDLKAEEILFRIETVMASKEMADKKHAITGDPVYRRLASNFQAQIRSHEAALEKALSYSHPDLARAIAEAPTAPRELSRIRQLLEVRRVEKLKQAQDAALGILEMILLAFGLSIAVMAWLTHLFYRGLMLPLKQLDEATVRIKEGDLDYRLPKVDGVQELRSLSDSFNAMASRLQALDQAKTEFLSTVSHEIKNPLAALKEGMNLLAVKGDELPPPSRAKAFSACLIATKRVESMINNLLKLSRGESGLFEFDSSVKSLTGAIQTAIDEVRPLADKKGMSISLRSEGEHFAPFNWDGMVQVFENLLLNAIKYGFDKTPIEVQVRRTARAMRGGEGMQVPHLEVAVINLGEGIDASESESIFQRFYRGSNSDQKQGLGIGLHVVKRVIEAHHGQAAASSEDGRTRFQIWIPENYEWTAGEDE